MISKINILDAAECTFWKDKVYACRNLWTPRFKAIDDTPLFYTIGKSIYLDYAESKEKYFENLEWLNAEIHTNFGGLLHRVKAALEDELKSNVELMQGYAVPGFHIFYKAGIENSSNSEPHFDLQYMRVNWNRKREEGKLISFTLPLALPKSGGGLDVWLPENAPNDQAEPGFIGYDCGTLVLQSDMLLHRISKTPDPHEDDERITLQGHGLRFDGTWMLYW